MPVALPTSRLFYGGFALGAMYQGDTKVWEPPVAASLYDPATQAFIDASGLDESFAPALDVLVVGLKNAGLWSKMLAVYPFIGGTDALHKWNLIDPRDTDDAYRLTFYGTGTHSVTLGYQPTPTGQWSLMGYADTHLVPSSVMAPDSTHLSLYSLVARPNQQRCDMGAYNWDGTTNRFHVIAHYISGEFYYSMSSLTMAQTPGGESTGLFVSTRTTMSDFAGYRNGALLAASVDAATALPIVPMSIGHLTGFDSEYSDLPFGFASLGEGMSTQEVADLYVAVQAYQEALGRSTPKRYWEES